MRNRAPLGCFTCDAGVSALVSVLRVPEEEVIAASFIVPSILQLLARLCASYTGRTLARSLSAPLSAISLEPDIGGVQCFVRVASESRVCVHLPLWWRKPLNNHGAELIVVLQRRSFDFSMIIFDSGSMMFTAR